uniref:GRF-type domain-containing protein n=1 Tax=Oryza glaberrima TaxID=4538 RepID=I1PP54_ORYGL
GKHLHKYTSSAQHAGPRRYRSSIPQDRWSRRTDVRHRLAPAARESSSVVEGGRTRSQGRRAGPSQSRGAAARDHAGRTGSFLGEPGMAVLCDCRRKAARWISWSEDNPSRRYLTCARARDGGCTFWSWYEPETTPYLRQVLNDLHNVVRGLKEEKSILRASLVSARAQIDELTAVHNGDVVDWTRKLKEKDDLACELRARVVQLEEGRKLLLLIVAGLVLLIVALWLRG